MNFLNVALGKPIASTQMTAQSMIGLASTPSPLASIVNWEEPVSHAYSTIRRDYELPVLQNQEFGLNLHISFKPIQETQTPRWLEQQGLSASVSVQRSRLRPTVPAIRHYSERALKRYEVRQKGCRDKTQCNHRFSLK